MVGKLVNAERTCNACSYDASLPSGVNFTRCSLPAHSVRATGAGQPSLSSTCTAHAGVLQVLAVADPAKRELMQAQAAPCLVKLLHAEEPELHESSLNILYSLCLEPENQLELQQSKLPKHILVAVPVSVVIV